MATDTADDTKHLVYILNEAGNLDEWLTSHPPSRLGKPAAFNNGVSPQPIWVLGVKSIDEIGELSPTASTETTFVKAKQMESESAAKVSDIQNDDDIPVRSSSKKAGKSKKQCRTEVQDQFHEQIMHMALDHALWSQGRWTMLIRPQQIDSVFIELAKSLASGDLRKQGSIIALRARTLPFEEGSFQTSGNGHKRKKSSSSSKSLASARHAHEAPLGIDIFFRPVWNTNVAKEVLKVVAGVSGRMASFCKPSLYSRLGIRSGHRLASHSSLYTSKHMASPADAKAWVEKHFSGDNAMDESQISSFGDAEPSNNSNVVSSFATPVTNPDKPAVGETAKRELEQEAFSSHTATKADEPALKRARNGGPSSDELQASLPEMPASSSTVKEGQSDMEETQDEPMLPVRRRAARASSDPCLSPMDSASLECHPHTVQKDKIEDTLKSTDTAATPETPAVKTPTAPKPDVALGMEDESQTQIEPSFAFDESKPAHVPAITIMGQKSGKNEDYPASWKRDTKMGLEPQAMTTEGKVVDESKAAATAKENAEKEAWPETSVDVKGSAKSAKEVKETVAPVDTKGEVAVDSMKTAHMADSDAAKDEGMVEPWAAGTSKTPDTESFKAEIKPSDDKAEATSVDASKPVQHKTPFTEASGPIANASEVKTKVASIPEEASAKSLVEKKDNISGAAISKDAKGDKKHATEPGESQPKTEVSMTLTAHTVETMEKIMPAREKRAQEPDTLFHDHKTASALEETEALKDVTDASKDLPQPSLELEESSSESTQITVEQSQEGKATQSSDGHTTIRPPAEAGDTEQHVTEVDTKPEKVNFDHTHKAVHEGIEASTTDPRNSTSGSAIKSESQASTGAPEMSLDELIVEGATTSPIILSQPLDETNAAK
ncbi:uncharacterized protein UTRI_06161_B [Ustilago trichophora]|uniref:Uncharacterized protein n=1 Tax=Ustilago trichophora TaxID=86804 RepID=A0A5C3EIJ6_9BASI|nr:uncharacterized protein UTRI_06161_B [Ustilago trichophora]